MVEESEDEYQLWPWGQLQQWGLSFPAGRVGLQNPGVAPFRIYIKLWILAVQRGSWDGHRHVLYRSLLTEGIALWIETPHATRRFYFIVYFGYYVSFILIKNSHLLLPLHLQLFWYFWLCCRNLDLAICFLMVSFNSSCISCKLGIRFNALIGLKFNILGEHILKELCTSHCLTPGCV